MEQWYGLTQEEVLKRLSTNRTGLSEEEAEKRLEVYGENILKEQEEMPWWQIFLGQFKDLLVMILIGAAGPFIKCHFRDCPAPESQKIPGKFKTFGIYRHTAASGRTDLHGTCFQGGSRRYPGFGNRRDSSSRRPHFTGNRPHLQ